MLPAIKKAKMPAWLYMLNVISVLLAISALVRGCLLGIWPLETLTAKFFVVYILASTLPAAFFLVATRAYLFSAQKKDEKHIEETLVNSIVNLEAGQEQLESEYVERFQKLIRDQQLLNELSSANDKNRRKIVRLMEGYFSRNSDYLPVMLISVFDLQGKSIMHYNPRSIRGDKAEAISKFFGLPMTINLRHHFLKKRPGTVFKNHNFDSESQMAYEAYGSGDKKLEHELERYRSTTFSMEFGRDRAVYLQDFIYIEGLPKFAILVSWKDTDIEKIVLKRSAARLGLKNPRIRILALKKNKKGIHYVLPPDRFFSQKMKKNFAELGKIAFGKDGGMSTAIRDNMTIVAYSSKKFIDLVLVAGIDHDEKNHNQLIRQMMIVLVGFFSVLIFIAMAIITYFRVIVPIKKIKGALINIQAGKLDFALETNRNDEVGLLTTEFSKMVSGLRERQRLASMLSDQAVEAIAQKDSPGTRLEDIRHSGVVLISDIRDFTTLCESHPPKVITQMLNTHFAEMAAIIVANGGRIYKFIGDAIEAVFIENEAESKSAEHRAFIAAVDMLLKLKQINLNRSERNLFTYRIGVGLAQGEIFCGGIGSSESRYDYAMIGTAFKRAESFEALTKPYVACPLIFDSAVKKKLDLDWAEIAAVENDEQIYRLSKLPDNLLNSYEIQQIESGKNLTEATAKNYNFIEKNRSYIKAFVFIMALLCVGTPFYGFIQSEYLKNKDFEKRSLEQVKKSCQSGINRFKGARLQTVFLEEFLSKEIEKVKNSLTWQKTGTDKQEFKKAIAKLLDEFKAAEIFPETFLAAYCDPRIAQHAAEIIQRKISKTELRVDTLARRRSESKELDMSLCELVAEINSGEFREDYLKLLGVLLNCELRTTSAHHEKAEIEKYIEKLTGKQTTLLILKNDLYARTVPVTRFGKDQFMYWETIGNWKDNEPDRNSLKASKLRGRPKFEDHQLAGSVMMFISRKNKDSAFNKIARLIMEQNGFRFLLINENSKAVEKSQDLPRFCSDLKFGDTSLVINNWFIDSTQIKIDSQKYQVFLVKPISKGNWTRFWWLASLACIGFLILSFMFRKAIYFESGLARKFSFQFWICLLAISIFPLTSVYFINEWHAVEQGNAVIKEERKKLIDTFDKLERRQYLHEAFEWETIDLFSKSKAFFKEFSKVNAKTSTSSINIFEEYIFQNLEPPMVPERPFRYHEMSVVSSKGWQAGVYPSKNKERRGQAGNFNMLVKSIITRLFKDLGSKMPVSKNGKSSLLSGVKEEMTMDAGLGISRMLFGSDVYFKLAHGLGKVIHIVAASGLANIKLCPIPDILKPAGIIFWYQVDGLNSAMRRIVRKAKTDYAVFSESEVMYGTLKKIVEGGWFRSILDSGRWAIFTKSPISERVKIGDDHYLLEARNGRYNSVMLLVGLAAEKPVLMNVEAVRVRVFYYILMAVLAIIFLAVIVAADINRPIKQLTLAVKEIEANNLGFRLPEDRKDEIGQLFIAFNSMAKGLHEKELMGKMVSRTARLAASNEESAQTAEEGMNLEVAIMYLSVPGFNAILENTSPNSIMEDLKNHVDDLCHIIMENGGDIDKIIGEKLLAVFYDPSGANKSANLAIRAAKYIRQANMAGRLKFPVTLGIHSGVVLAGLLGVGNHRDFTVIGDTVNTAARIAGKASLLPRENYLVSEKIRNFADSTNLEFKAFGEVELKGKAEAVKLYQPGF